MTPVDGNWSLPLTLDTPQQAPAPQQQDAFGEVLGGALASVNQAVRGAHAAGQDFAAGTNDDIHGTMLAISKADIEFRLVGTMRTKVVDAFYELWRLQV